MACCSARLGRLSNLPMQMSRCPGCTCRCAWSPSPAARAASWAAATEGKGGSAGCGWPHAAPSASAPARRRLCTLRQGSCERGRGPGSAERACPACMASRGRSQGTMSSAGQQGGRVQGARAWQGRSRAEWGRGSPRQRRAGAEQRACCALQRQRLPSSRAWLTAKSGSCRAPCRGALGGPRHAFWHYIALRNPLPFALQPCVCSPGQQGRPQADPRGVKVGRK
jgi:hypothetical protein